ncbi:MAG: type III-A CRISPR-associated RAMP protein Csm5 [candidate division WOR-3 bacterium]|nr:type III-A CRISPR-associated RAMP protein Csm5 [candidate division WOR-3 bacterium]
MKVKIKILSPLHIGSGAEISPMEYLVENANFHRLNMDSLFKDVEFKPHMDKFIEIAKTSRYIGNILPQPLLKKHILYTIPIKGEALKYLNTKRTVVKEFVKTAGYVYIPGSSIKGSIFSAIFWYSLREAYRNNINWSIKKEGEPTPISAQAFIISALQRHYNYNELLDLAFYVFTKNKTKSRFARWVRISDTNKKSVADTLQISLAKVKGAKRGGELPILYEALKSGSEFEFEINAEHSVYNESKIIDIVDEFYRKVLNKDKSDIKPSGKLIRLGQGSTAYSTSCLILAEELKINGYRVKPPTTRKRIDDTIPLGWAEIIG